MTKQPTKPSSTVTMKAIEKKAQQGLDSLNKSVEKALEKKRRLSDLEEPKLIKWSINFITSPLMRLNY